MLTPRAIFIEKREDAVSVVMPALFRLPPVPVAMCEWWLAHCGCAVCLVGGGVLGVAVFCGCLCLGSVGGLAMCEWWLSHWGLFGCSLVWVVGGSGLFAGFWRPGVFLWGRYVRVVAGTLGGLRGCLVRGVACLLGSGFVMCPSGSLCASGG